MYVTSTSLDTLAKPVNKSFLGYADVIQSPMEEECEIIGRGYSTGSPEAYAMIPQNERVSIKQVKNEWIMFFQMGTIENDSCEMMFGDCGYIYLGIGKQDLLEFNFNNCWLISLGIGWISS